MTSLTKSSIIFLTVILFLESCHGQYTESQKKELLDKHNDGRRKQAAADMNELVWDATLATEGQTLAETCKDGHVTVTVAGITTVGQNLYWKSGTSDPVLAYDAWYEEIQAYKKDTDTCLPDRICGHYRMVVLNHITKVGCGFKVCSEFTKKDGVKISQVTFVVCHYDSAPLASGAVFTKGAPCTKCGSGKFWCNNDLCKSSCTTSGDQCKCYAKYEGVCENCATHNENDCTCKCADGYLGTHCAETCEDLNIPGSTDIQKTCTADVKDDAEYYCTGDGSQPYIGKRTCKATCAPFTKYCTVMTPALKTAATTGCTQTKPEVPPSGSGGGGGGGDATTATPDPCLDYKCVNGAKVTQGTSCKCNCNKKWSGVACDVTASGAPSTKPCASTMALQVVFISCAAKILM